MVHRSAAGRSTGRRQSHSDRSKSRCPGQLCALRYTLSAVLLLDAHSSANLGGSADKACSRPGPTPNSTIYLGRCVGEIGRQFSMCQQLPAGSCRTQQRSVTADQESQCHLDLHLTVTLTACNAASQTASMIAALDLHRSLFHSRNACARMLGACQIGTQERSLKLT